MFRRKKNYFFSAKCDTFSRSLFFPLFERNFSMRPQLQLFSMLSTVRYALCAVLFLGGVSVAYADDFNQWKLELRAEALEKGISEAIFDSAFADVKPIERVIELDRSQPEFTMTLEKYIRLVISQTRINNASKKIEEHAEILDEVEKKYGVQKRFIVALWGIETNFGTHTGGFGVVPALATLAFDGRRSAYFRKELLNALTILEEGHIAVSDMKGSWAGAMGQSQFMPSSFLSYAVDYDGDGRRDIWTTRKDVFASIANYLSSVGWRDDVTWGREVVLPQGLDGQKLSDSKALKTMDEWRALGVTSLGGEALPERNLKSRLILPKNGAGRAFLAYSNYDAILKWNRSDFFAVAVGTLSDTMR